MGARGHGRVGGGGRCDRGAADGPRNGRRGSDHGALDAPDRARGDRCGRHGDVDVDGRRERPSAARCRTNDRAAGAASCCSRLGDATHRRCCRCRVGCLPRTAAEHRRLGHHLGNTARNRAVLHRGRDARLVPAAVHAVVDHASARLQVGCACRMDLGADLTRHCRRCHSGRIARWRRIRRGVRRSGAGVGTRHRRDPAVGDSALACVARRSSGRGSPRLRVRPTIGPRRLRHRPSRSPKVHAGVPRQRSTDDPTRYAPAHSNRSRCRRRPPRIDDHRGRVDPGQHRGCPRDVLVLERIGRRHVAALPARPGVDRARWSSNLGAHVGRCPRGDRRDVVVGQRPQRSTRQRSAAQPLARRRGMAGGCVCDLAAGNPSRRCRNGRRRAHRVRPPGRRAVRAVLPTRKICDCGRGAPWPAAPLFQHRCRAVDSRPGPRWPADNR